MGPQRCPRHAAHTMRMAAMAKVRRAPLVDIAVHSHALNSRLKFCNMQVAQAHLQTIFVTLLVRRPTTMAMASRPGMRARQRTISPRAQTITLMAMLGLNPKRIKKPRILSYTLAASRGRASQTHHARPLLCRSRCAAQTHNSHFPICFCIRFQPLHAGPTRCSEDILNGGFSTSAWFCLHARCMTVTHARCARA